MIERKKTVDNIYSTFDSPSNFKNIFKQTRKSKLIGLTATRNDTDGDGLSDGEEIITYGTNPTS